MRLVERGMAEGYLTIYKKYPNGALEKVLDGERNVITFDSRRLHLRYLYDHGNAPKDNIIGFKVGSGGAVGVGAASKVINPDPMRNDLYTPVATPVNSTITIAESPPPAPGELDSVYINVTFSLSQDEANGVYINECGLFKESGNMFNHKTFKSIEKTESFSLVFNWKIQYV